MQDDGIARLNLMASTYGAVAKGTVKRGKYPEFVSRWTSEHDVYESLLEEAPTPSLDMGVPEGISAVERIRAINPAAIGRYAYIGGPEDELETAATEIPDIVSYATAAAEVEARGKILGGTRGSY